MASDYYLLLTGIEGETEAEGMTNAIGLQSWTFSARSDADMGGSGLSAGKPDHSDFICSFDLDKASFQLITNLHKGTHIDSATFSGRKTGGNATPYTYLVVTLTKVFVTGFNTGGGSTGTPVANLSLAYQKIQYQYYTQGTDGTVTLAGESSYDRKLLQAA
jgi:type VI protein secretion system component Hcp